MSKDYKNRVTTRGTKTVIYSGLLWFSSGIALGGLVIGAGVLWLRLGSTPSSVENPPVQPKTQISEPKPNVEVAITPKPTEVTPPQAPKLEFEYDEILRNTQVTLPDPNQDAQIIITQPPPPKEPSPIATAESPIPNTPAVSTALPIKPIDSESEDTNKSTKDSTKRSSKKTGTTSISTTKTTSKKLATKLKTKTSTTSNKIATTKIATTVNTTKNKTTKNKTTKNKTVSKRSTDDSDIDMQSNTNIKKVVEKPKSKAKSKSKSEVKTEATTQATAENKSKSKSKSKSKTDVTSTKVTKPKAKPITSTDKSTKQKGGVVQIGAFQNEEDVKKLRARMALMGIETTVQKVTKNNKTIQRLRTTPYNDANELNEAKKLFTKHNIKTFTIQ